MIRVLLTVVVLLAAGAARAETASPWAEDGSSAIRLIAGRPAEPDGSVVAGIAIRLTPGWKTYWREPGESGVPPRFDWTGSRNLKSVEVLFPAPKRFKDGDGWTVGYDESLVLPVRVTPERPGEPIHLALSISYATCERLCVPASGQAQLRLAPQEETDRYTAAGIARALEKLPKSTDPSVSAEPSMTVERAGDGSLRVVVHGEGEADLFAHGAEQWSPPLPVLKQVDPDGRRLFSIKIDKAPPGARLTLVAVSEKSATEMVLDARAPSP